MKAKLKKTEQSRAIISVDCLQSDSWTLMHFEIECHSWAGLLHCVE